MKWLQEADRRLLAPGSNHLLGCVRVGLAVVLGLRAAMGPYRALAGQPAALFDPPWWIVAGIDRMPATAVIVAIQVVAVVAAVACVSGRAPRAGFAGARLGLLVLAAVTVLHAGTWLTLGLDYWARIATVAVLVAPWDEVISIRHRAAPCVDTRMPAPGPFMKDAAHGGGRRRTRLAASWR